MDTKPKSTGQKFLETFSTALSFKTNHSIEEIEERFFKIGLSTLMAKASTNSEEEFFEKIKNIYKNLEKDELFQHMTEVVKDGLEMQNNDN